MAIAIGHRINGDLLVTILGVLGRFSIYVMLANNMQATLRVCSAELRKAGLA